MAASWFLASRQIAPAHIEIVEHGIESLRKF
jgi:hypothetical protein